MKDKVGNTLRELSYDQNVIINPLVLSIVNSKMMQWGSTYNSAEFMTEYLRCYREIDNLLKTLPNYYYAGMTLESGNGFPKGI